MTRDEALNKLETGSAHERLTASRELLRGARASDLPVLRAARQTETVSYVKNSLDACIARLSNLPATAPIDQQDQFLIPAELTRQLRRQAVDWIAGILLHEISSQIGLVKLAASKEIQDYDFSTTKHHLEHVQRTFDAIEMLKNATAVPRPAVFDLAALINEIVALEGAASGSAHSFSLIGPQPLAITSDPTLVRLAVVNGVRNALEAMSEIDAVRSDSPVITWGETDVDYWVSVLDHGAGMIGPAESAFEIGKSTKQRHSGFGLPIARQAIETLGGTVTLQPGALGGARYEVRWER